SLAVAAPLAIETFTMAFLFRKPRRVLARSRSHQLRLEPLSARIAPSVSRSAFNDASGINSNATQDSPFKLNSLLDGGGVGEPGWNGGWVGHETWASLVQSDVVYEGDGAMRMTAGTSGAARLWSPTVASGVVTISQMIYIPPGG